MDPVSTTAQVYMGEDSCSGWVEIALDIFVTVKAVVLIYFSSQGIYWFLKNSFIAMAVIFILLVSCTLVISEMAYRFTDRSLRYRFIQNAVAQWQVFTCLTVMLGFARRNDAAKSKVPIRVVFVPTHILYATLLFWGICNEHMGECNSRTYPNIFTYQYALFFLTYIGFLFLHKNHYFMEWDEKIRDMDPERNDIEFESDEDRRKLRVKMIFTAQSERFKCFFTWLISLTVFALVIVVYQLKKNHGNSVICSPDGNHWLFADCSARFFVQFLHVFTTMQCAAMARTVFIKTVKKVEQNHSFVRYSTKNYS